MAMFSPFFMGKIIRKEQDNGETGRAGFAGFRGHDTG